MPYELLPQDAGIKATGGTRAGLLIASMQGMFAAAGARYPEEEAPEELRHEFALEAPDFASLLTALLDKALEASGGKESFQDISFKLITDKKALGEFVGKKVMDFTSPVKAVDKASLKVEKNLEGLWEATITFL